jgi:hypothetical protein
MSSLTPILTFPEIDNFLKQCSGQQNSPAETVSFLTRLLTTVQTAKFAEEFRNDIELGKVFANLLVSGMKSARKESQQEIVNLIFENLSFLTNIVIETTTALLYQDLLNNKDSFSFFSRSDLSIFSVYYRIINRLLSKLPTAVTVTVTELESNSLAMESLQTLSSCLLLIGTLCDQGDQGAEHRTACSKLGYFSLILEGLKKIDSLNKSKSAIKVSFMTCLVLLVVAVAFALLIIFSYFFCYFCFYFRVF